jgi:hypothetical protein
MTTGPRTPALMRGLPKGTRYPGPMGSAHAPRAPSRSPDYLNGGYTLQILLRERSSPRSVGSHATQDAAPQKGRSDQPSPAAHDGLGNCHLGTKLYKETPERPTGVGGARITLILEELGFPDAYKYILMPPLTGTLLLHPTLCLRSCSPIPILTLASEGR